MAPELNWKATLSKPQEKNLPLANALAYCYAGWMTIQISWISLKSGWRTFWEFWGKDRSRPVLIERYDINKITLSKLETLPDLSRFKKVGNVQ